MTAGQQEPLPDISVLIVSYNTCHLTLRCIETVLQYVDGIDIEVVVVDNASSDGSAEEIRNRYPNVVVIASDVNGGFAFGNNLGFKVARGRYVLLLNPDTEVRENTLVRCLRYMDMHPEVGVLGCRVRYGDGSQQSTIFRYLRLRDLVLNIVLPNRLTRKHPLLGQSRYARLSRDEIQDVDIVAGCFMMVPRHVIETAGDMNTIFFMYGEEAEWCHRISRYGFKVRYYPDAEIMHHGAASTSDDSEWKILEMAKGQILFLRVTRGYFVAWVGNLLMFLRDLVRLVTFLPLRLSGKANSRSFARNGMSRLIFHWKSVWGLPGGQRVGG
ncbi:glycosyltransferase family 2 protein [Parvibaculum sp.]|uniref:glycosyltransferase family 2 protein n=1 Tax=Parvibaculum sp. TaxID=2024848 RepID=UPI001DC09511|nr:glycosyltransferase family 2 protein [Parvibaculum sp.]MBX3489210.1 glycosyltransferase family 2 protein [Parvibaculum sp.]